MPEPKPTGTGTGNGSSTGWRRAADAYEGSSKHAKRAVVGGSALVVNYCGAAFYHHALGLDPSPEEAAVVGGIIAGVAAWVWAGGILELILSFAEARRKIREAWRR